MRRDEGVAIPASVGKSCQILALVTTFCAVAFVGVSAEQIIEKQVHRFGPVGRSLSEREIIQIVDLANAAGKPAWLVLGFPSMISGVTRLTVFLHPDKTTERIRRGRILCLVAYNGPVVTQRSDWIVEQAASYAYVPILGSAGEMANENDLAWPFAVDGDFDDETLTSLVTFVRRPPIPGIPADQAPRQVVGGPLSLVWRRGDQFIVAFRGRDGAEVVRSRSSERTCSEW
jgi:hypothetical protein